MSQVESIETKVYRYAFEQKSKGKGPEEIEQSLISKGLDANSAKVVTQGVEENYESYLNAKRKVADKNMLHGGLWCGGGLLVTLITYNMASDGGSPYVVAWGAIIFGAIQFFRGVSQRP